jgi:hypothetical protein
MDRSVLVKRFFTRLLLLGLVVANAPAFAHDVPPGIAMLDIGRSAIDVELQLPLNELGSALDLPLAADPAAVVPRYQSQIERHIQGRFHLRSHDGQPYALQLTSFALRKTDNANWTSNDWLIVRGSLHPPASQSTEIFSVEDSVIVQRVVSHQILVYVRRDLRNGLLGDKPMAIGVLDFGNAHLDVDGSAGSWWQGFRHLFSLGLHHIAEGPDHLLFLLALLLPAPLFATAGRWGIRKPIARSARTIIGVVSGFTLGHSITLALAATGWLVAPGRIVEVLIAVSILVSSFHAMRPLFAGREAWIASAFGLIHGLAFAEVLAGLNFDGTTLVLSLIGFNLGIEAMQLLVIAATLPLMLLASAAPFYRYVRLTGAGFAAACAIGWIMERAFGMSNPLQAIANWMAPPPIAFVVTVCVASAIAALMLLNRSRLTTSVARIDKASVRL